MYLIEFYILRRICTLFFSVFMVSICMIWSVQILERIDFLLTNGQTFLTVLKFSSLFIPSAVQLVMPFALVIASAQVFSILNQDSELVVINASGSPRKVVWRPVLLLGLIVSVCSFLIVNFIAPHASLTRRQMMAAAHSDLVSTLLQEGSFRSVGNNIFIQIGERHADGSIGRLYIVDQSNPDFQQFNYAVSGSVISNEKNNFLVLKNGEMQRRDNKSGNISIIKYDTYTLDLDQFTPVAKIATIYPKDQFLTYLLHPDPDDPYYQLRPMQYTAEIHRRFTGWLYPFVFALIVLVAAGDARSHRETSGSATFLAIVLSLAIFFLSYFFESRADNDLAYVPLLYITPIATGAVLLFMLLTNRHIHLPAGWVDIFNRLWGSLKRHLIPGRQQNGDAP